jgi:hypothetical protein
MTARIESLLKVYLTAKMNNKQNPYQQIAWIKALNKQGFITCCQLISSMKYYVQKNQTNISKEEMK